MIADGKGGAATLDTSKDEPAQGLEERRGEERRDDDDKPTNTTKNQSTRDDSPPWRSWDLSLLL